MKEVKKFNYLLGMSMWMLTKEKKDELLKQRDQKLVELNELKLVNLQLNTYSVKDFVKPQTEHGPATSVINTNIIFRAAGNAI